MSLINVSNLTFAYDGSFGNVFENTSFQIDSAWKLGLVGRNGRGKTTLLRLLAGELEYSGSIAANLCFEFFPYPVADKSQPTIKIIDAINPDYQPWQLERELNLLEVSCDVICRPFSTLSNGEQTKILLAIMFLRENSFLLIDEPTNHLDLEARELVSRYLRSKSGFILVSHDRAFLDNCVDHIMSINKAGIEIQKGNFSSWMANKTRQDSFELAQNEQLKKDISQLKNAARRTAEWADKVEREKIGFDPLKTEKSAGRRSYNGEKSRKLMKQSKNFENRQNTAAEQKSQLLKNIEKTETLKLSPLTHHARVLVQMEKLSVLYNDKIICREISLTIERGDRIALHGRNGSGKSSLLKLICGQKIEYTGKLSVASGLKISYVPQDASFLSGNLSDFAVEHQIDESLFKAILSKLDFSKLQFDRDMTDFSEGQKKKVLIARSLCEKAHLYIWDEPLNFIDVFSRMQIEELLLTFKPTIIFVEHDRTFSEKIAIQTIDL